MVSRARRRWITWKAFEWTLLLLASLLLVLASVAGYFGRVDWRVDLLSNFKAQFYLVALVLCAIAAWRNYRFLLGLNLIVFLWNGWEIINFAPQSIEAHPQTFRAISINVHTQNKQLDRVEAWIREQEPDFVGLIECTPEWLPTFERLKDILPYQRTRVFNAYGTAVLSRFPPTEPTPAHRFAGIGSLPYEVETPDGPLLVVLAHPLSPINERQWKYRGNALEEIALFAGAESVRVPMLVMGDFNTTPWSPFFSDFVMQSRLQHVDTSFLPRRTWPTHNPLAWIPIDHFFLSDQLAPIHDWVGPDLGSDHYPIALDFVFQEGSD